MYAGGVYTFTGLDYRTGSLDWHILVFTHDAWFDWFLQAEGIEGPAAMVKSKQTLTIDHSLQMIKNYLAAALHNLWYKLSILCPL